MLVAVFCYSSFLTLHCFVLFGNNTFDKATASVIAVFVTSTAAAATATVTS